MSKLEGFWEESVTGTRHVPAKWSYSEALAEVQENPAKYQLKPADFSLNETSIVEPTAYLRQWNQLGGYRNEMIIESRYRYVLFLLALTFDRTDPIPQIASLLSSLHSVYQSSLHG
jgi:hypothetical protein